MLTPARLAATALLLAFVSLIAGCPHRSPLWSPDGKRLLVLAGPRGESPDLPASELWLVDVEKGAAKRLDAPKDGARFLAGAWLDEKTFVIATGELAGEETREGSEAWWKRSVDASDWTRLDIPPPSGARIPKRLPVVLHSNANGTERIVLVYPTGWEDTIAIELEKREELWRGELTEIAGRGPEGGFIAQRETAAGGLELVSFDGAFSKRWSKSFSELREELAKKRGARPVDIVFNDASTSHLPFPGARGEASDASERDWVGVVLWFSDVSWRDGVSGHYVRLAAKDGAVIDSVGARGLPGKPASVEGQAWGIVAPESADQAPSLRAYDLASGRVVREFPFENVPKECVHGYAADPAGKRLAVVLAFERPSVTILEEGKDPRRIELKAAE